MTGPFFPSVDSTTLKLRDQHLPDRLSSASLTETIQDTVGSMAVGVLPATVTYNDTLGTLSVGSASGPVGAQCRIYRNTTQTITAGSIQGVTLNTAGANDDTQYFSTDLAAGKITVLQAGSYLVSWAIRFSAATSGERYSSISVNGTANTRFESGGTRADLHTVTGSAPLRLATNDFVNLCAFVSGASVDVQGSNSFHTWMALVRLGA